MAVFYLVHSKMQIDLVLFYELRFSFGSPFAEGFELRTDGNAMDMDLKPEPFVISCSYTREVW